MRMALKETMAQLEMVLAEVAKDLTKVHRGNRSAAQRVRVGTIRLEKVAKKFRKESVSAEKGGKLKKKAPAKGGGRKGASSKKRKKA